MAPPAVIVQRVVRLSAVLSVLLAFGLAAGQGVLLRALCSDAAVVAAAGAIWPTVVWTQPVSVFAFVWDGLLFGARDFAGAAGTVIAAAVPALVLLAGAAGLGAEAGLERVWLAIAVYMALRVVFGAARLFRPSSPLRR